MMNVFLRYQRIGAKYLSLAIIDLRDVTAILEELGYRVTDRLPPSGFRRSIAGSGPIAQKGGVTVDVDTVRHILGISSPDPEQLISEFEAVEEALSSRLRGYTRPRFYEAMVELEVSVKGADFYSVFEGMSDLTPVNAVSETLRVEASLMGVRIGLKGARPEGDEWMDVEIMPSTLKKDDVLYISLLYRSPDKARVFDTVRKGSLLASKLVKSLLRT